MQFIEKGGKPSCSLCRKWKIPCEYVDRLQNQTTTLPVNSSHISNSIENMDIEQEHLPWSLGPNTSFFASPQDPAAFEALPYPMTSPSAPYNTDTWEALMSYSDAQYRNIPSIPTDLNSGGVIAEKAGSLITSSGFDLGHICPPQQHDISNSQLPPKPKLLELSRIFFDHHSHFIPCIHKDPFLEMLVVASDTYLQQSSLVYAIIALAARDHPDPIIREHQTVWYTKSSELWATHESDPSVSLQALQAGCCLTLLGFVAGDYTLSFVSLGKTWRLVCSMRLNLIDASSALPQCNDVNEIRADPRQGDECQRILWTLFILDRALSFPCGMPHAIDDRQFIVDLPRTNLYHGPVGVSEISRYHTQGFITVNHTNIRQENDLAQPIPFTRDVQKLSRCASEYPGKTSIFCYVLQAYMILGRITEYISALGSFSDAEEISEEAEMKSLISQFRLGLPRWATTLAAARPAEFRNVVWLNMILNIHTIIFDHRKIMKGPAQQTSSRSSDESPTSSIPRSGSAPEGQLDDIPPSRFGYCVAAAQNMVQQIRDISRVSIDPLLNPHLALPFYLCSRILVVEWLETKDDALRLDIDVLITLLDRFEESFPTLGGKYKKILAWDLSKSVEAAAIMKRSGARIFVDCRKP